MTGSADDIEIEGPKRLRILMQCSSIANPSDLLFRLSALMLLACVFAWATLLASKAALTTVSVPASSSSAAAAAMPMPMPMRRPERPRVLFLGDSTIRMAASEFATHHGCRTSDMSLECGLDAHYGLTRSERRWPPKDCEGPSLRPPKDRGKIRSQYHRAGQRWV